MNRMNLSLVPLCFGIFALGSACEVDLKNDTATTPPATVSQVRTAAAQFCKWMDATRVLAKDEAQYGATEHRSDGNRVSFDSKMVRLSTDCSEPRSLSVDFKYLESEAAMDFEDKYETRMEFNIDPAGAVQVSLFEARNLVDGRYRQGMKMDEILEMEFVSAVVCSKAYGECETDSVSDDVARNRLQITLKSTKDQTLLKKRRNGSGDESTNPVIFSSLTIKFDLYRDQINISRTDPDFPVSVSRWKRSRNDL
jgi:hypothetical protein